METILIAGKTYLVDEKRKGPPVRRLFATEGGAKKALRFLGHCDGVPEQDPATGKWWLRLTVSCGTPC